MWEKIKNKPNYQVNEYGMVRNIKTKRVLKKFKRKDGYEQVMLGRKTTPVYVHRIVAEAFLEKRDECNQVDHINGDKSDNRPGNLRWVTARDNYLGFGYEERILNRCKAVNCFNVLTKEKITFSSRKEAAEYFCCSSSHIKYNRLYKKGKKKNWCFELVKDIV